jgi:hypothetical protein
VKYTAKEIEELIATARAANLEGVELLNGDPEAIAAKYNGIGPEEWPEEWRRAITRCFNLFQPAALIHDLRFTYASGTRRDFNYANVEFHNNCLKLARFSIPWWRVLRRFLADGSALAFYEAVSSPFGWDAYVKATSKG